jgi:type II secretory pathway pseudopilin PulG
MIFKRAVAKLRAQDWTAISIELAIVILGVFIGTWVANWNQQRQAARETRQTLLQLKPELQQLEAFSKSAHIYYATTGRYADTALAGWHGDPAVSDAQFVIAAYQASQIYGFNNNGASWALVFGASDLRNIPDPDARQALTRLMTFDYSTINIGAVQTRYRDRVREVIPDSIQQTVRNSCGDIIDAARGTVELHPACPIAIDPALTAATAAELRRDPTLRRLLGQHRSVVSAFLANLELFDGQERILTQRIRALGG